MTLALMAAVLCTGLMAGLYAAFSYSVMPGLRRADDRTFVGAFQQINIAIQNPLFFIIFTGPLIFTTIAVVLEFRADDGTALPWLIAGLLLYAATVAITAAVNVPLNNRLDAVGTPGTSPDALATLTAARTAFEARWIRWNHARAVLSVAALLVLTWALQL